MRDITIGKEIEKQKETFVATLSHDLKTPIRAEIMALELLMKGRFGELNSEQFTIVQDTLYSSKFMFNMVDNLLSTYRYENGNVKLIKDFIDINHLINLCCNEQKYIIDDKKLNLSLDFCKEEIMVYVDPIEMKRVIMNLLTNAVSYTDIYGNILIKARN